MTEKEIVAAGYIRVSSVHQIENESLDNQERNIQDYARLSKWQYTKTYRDEGVSGKKSSRPGLDELLRDAQKGAINVVIVDNLSRFGRTTADVLNNVGKLRDYNCHFVSIKEKLDGTGPYGEFMLAVFAAIAQLEHHMIKVRMEESREHKWEEGRTFVGTTPFGYKADRPTKDTVEIVTIESEKRTYLKMVSLYLDEKMSIQDVALELDRLHFKPRRGKLWCTATIAQYFHNPTYCLGKVTGNTKKGPVEFECEPFVAKKRWDEIQERMANSVKRVGRPNKAVSTHLLAGLLECGVCGAKVVPRTEYKTGRRYYCCYWKEAHSKLLQSNDRERCPLPRFEAEKLESQVYEGISRLLFDTFKASWVDPTQNENPWDAKIKELEQTIAELEQQRNSEERALKRVEDMIYDDDFSAKEYRLRKASIRTKIATRNLEIKEALAELEQRQQAKAEQELLLQFATDKREAIEAVRKVYNSLPLEQRQKLVKGLLDGNVTLLPNKYRIYRLQHNPLILQEILLQKYPVEAQIRY